MNFEIVSDTIGPIAPIARAQILLLPRTGNASAQARRCVHLDSIRSQLSGLTPEDSDKAQRRVRACTAPQEPKSSDMKGGGRTRAPPP